MSKFWKETIPEGYYDISTQGGTKNGRSIQTNWHVSKKTIELSEYSKNKTIIIARHNSPIIEFLPYLNGSLGMSKTLENIKRLKKSFNNKKNYYWIVGDSGSVKNLPRLTCYKSHNHIFILNQKNLKLLMIT